MSPVDPVGAAGRRASDGDQTTQEKMRSSSSQKDRQAAEVEGKLRLRAGYTRHQPIKGATRTQKMERLEKLAQ
jgi:hypothetical protein